MATVSASAVATTDSLETFRQRFNTLRSDIQALTFESTIVFEGATANDFETSLTVVDPTADRTITLPDRSDTVALLGDIEDKILLNGTDSSGTDSGDHLLLNATSDGVDVGEKVLQETATSDPLLNRAAPDLDDVLLESSSSTRKHFLLDEVEAVRIEYEDATSDNLLGSLFVPPASGGIQFTMPASDGIADQILGTDGNGNLSFKNQSSGLSLGNDGNNRVITATGSNSGNGEANLTFDGSTLVITGAVDMSGAFDTDGVASAATFEPDGDTSAGDNAAIGYTSALGLILTGQGSTNDVTIVNDADATVLSVATGGTDVDIVGDVTAATLNADGDTSAGDNAAIGYTSAEGLILTGQGSTSDITLKNDADTTVFSVPTGSDDILFPDGAKILLGAGSDLEIFHDGSDSHIKDTGTGDLYISASDDLVLRTKAGAETALVANDDGSVELYYDNTFIFATGNNKLVNYSTSNKQGIIQHSTGLFIVLDGTDANGTDAGDNIIIEDGGTDGSGTNAGDDILHENWIYAHTGLQREVLEIRSSGGSLLKSLSGFAEGAI